MSVLPETLNDDQLNIVASITSSFSTISQYEEYLSQESITTMSNTIADLLDRKDDLTPLYDDPEFLDHVVITLSNLYNIVQG